MKLSSVISRVRGCLEPKFGRREATQLIYFALEQLKGWSGVQVAMHLDDDVTDFLSDKLDQVASRLLSGEPIQYIFSSAHFYGLDFKVNKATLIPRPETAQLVDIIVNDFAGRPDLRVVDLGTGSGCIAIALARNLRFPEVVAVDISAEALEVARENAKSLNVNVDFRSIDMLDSLALESLGQVDIIVSNPPYIIVKEAENMDVNVLDYEPHTALFVPEDDPLRFYKPIAAFAATNLVDGGKVYLEINPMFADEVQRLFQDAGLGDVDIQKDFQMRNRFVIASK